MDQIQVNASRPYEILFGPGSFEQLSVKLSEVCRSVRSACIVCDHTVAALYAARAEHLLRGLGYAVSRFSFSDTERANTTDIYERLVGHLHETQFDANGLLIAMGGGIVHDSPDIGWYDRSDGTFETSDYYKQDADRVYALLEECGYRLSEMEEQLRDGTHECYQWDE